MNWTALALVAVKWAPKIVTFIQTEAPAVQELIKDVEGALTSPAASTAVDLGSLIQQLLPHLQTSVPPSPQGTTVFRS